MGKNKSRRRNDAGRIEDREARILRIDERRAARRERRNSSDEVSVFERPLPRQTRAETEPITIKHGGIERRI